MRRFNLSCVLDRVVTVCIDDACMARCAAEGVRDCARYGDVDIGQAAEAVDRSLAYNKIMCVAAAGQAVCNSPPSAPISSRVCEHSRRRRRSELDSPPALCVVLLSFPTCSFIKWAILREAIAHASGVLFVRARPPARPPARP